MLGDVVHGHGVRVMQARGDAALPHDALARLCRGARGALLEELLDRDRALESFVVGQPHDPHRAAAEVSSQPVPAREQRTDFTHRARPSRWCVPRSG